MQEVYAELPNVSVEPLHFASSDISAERLLSMMKVNSGEGGTANSLSPSTRD